MITDKMIEGAMWENYRSIDIDSLMNSLELAHRDGFKAGAKFAQDKILEMASEEKHRKERAEMKEALIDIILVCDELLEIESTPHLDHHFEIFEKHAKLIEKLKGEK